MLLDIFRIGQYRILVEISQPMRHLTYSFTINNCCKWEHGTLQVPDNRTQWWADAPDVLLLSFSSLSMFYSDQWTPRPIQVITTTLQREVVWYSNFEQTAFLSSSNKGLAPSLCWSNVIHSTGGLTVAAMDLHIRIKYIGDKSVAPACGSASATSKRLNKFKKHPTLPNLAV